MDPIVRPDIRVVARILSALHEAQRPMRPTQLQLSSRTNYSQFARYLETLAARGLVEVRGGNGDERWIELTPRGAEAYQYLVRGFQAILDGSDPRGPR